MTKDEALKMALEAMEDVQAMMTTSNWFNDRLEAVRQALDQLPDTTKMIDNVYIRYWVQDTMESGRWVTTDSMSKSTAETLLFNEYCSAFPQGEIVELPEMPVDRGAWSDVPDATKWVDELRGDEPPNSATNVVEPETAKETPQGICRTDGRCQYAIDSGAEGMGWCPEGKCVMPRPDVVEPEEWDHPPMRDCDCPHCKEYWSDVYGVEPIGEIVEAHGLVAVSIPEMPPVGTKLYAAPPVANVNTSE